MDKQKRGSPLKIETKFVTAEELRQIIYSNYIPEYTRYEFYKK